LGEPLAKNFFAGWKKLSTNGKNTIMAHPRGHKMVISHKTLKPEHLEQLQALPFHTVEKTGNVKAAKAPKTPKAPEIPKFADGGSAPPSDSPPEAPKKNAEEMQKGATSGGTSASEAWSNLKSGLGFANGGEANTTYSPIGGDEADTTAVSDEEYERNKRFLEQQSTMRANTPQSNIAPSDKPTTNEIGTGIPERHYELGKHAKGGYVTDATARLYADGSDAEPVSLDDNAPQATPAQDTPEAIQQAAAQPQGTIDQAAPDQQTPSELPQQGLTRLQQLYNSTVNPLPDAKGGSPDADEAQSRMFGPNGEPPANFDPVAAEKAKGMLAQEQLDQKQAATQANQLAQFTNKQRTDFGLAPLPTAMAADKGATDAKRAIGQDTEARAAGAQGAQSPLSSSASNYYENLEKGFGQQYQGILNEAQATENLSKAKASALESMQQPLQNLQTEYNTHLNNLNSEIQNITKDIAAGHINPNQLWEDSSAPSKVASAIGLILGGIGGGLQRTGGNAALDFLNKQIDRNIDAQKANLGQKQHVLGALQEQFNNLSTSTGVQKALMQNVVANQLDIEAAKAGGPIAQARAAQAAGALRQQAAAGLSQAAMRKALLGGANSGQLPPEYVINAMLPQGEDKNQTLKELKDARDAVNLRDNALDSFDQVAKLNTVAGTLNPETQLKIAALKNATLDKLTKDTSGRVTPETVHLIGSIFDTKFANQDTINVQRRELDKLLTQKMNYPRLNNPTIGLGIDPFRLGKYDRYGNPILRERQGPSARPGAQ
jgi:hypothetical protein